MVQVQVRIEAQAGIVMAADILAREDANEQEIRLAAHIEAQIMATMAQAARIVGAEVKINELSEEVSKNEP